MFSRIFKILTESISSVTNVNQWEMITKDMLKQGITGYKPMVRDQPVESCPKFSEGQLVIIKYHQKFPHLHKEIGIILVVNDFDTFEGMGPLHFYEVLVGDEKVTLIERYLDGVDQNNENRRRD
tara:strand:- start:343 stop:714 length:372 start_codon:yes stop_codon:yes gene_type:complete